MDNTFIVEPSSSEEEETDSDGNDGWLKHDKQDVIYDPKTMFLDMKPKQLPSFSQTNDLTKTYRMVIDSNDLIPLDKDGKEIEKDLPDDSDIKTHYSPQFIFGFRLDFNKLSHKSGGFKNVTEIHIQNLYVNPVTSGDRVNGIHNGLTHNIDFDDIDNSERVSYTMNITITNPGEQIPLTTELAKRFVDYVKGPGALTNTNLPINFTPIQYATSSIQPVEEHNGIPSVSHQEDTVCDLIYNFLVVISRHSFQRNISANIGVVDIFYGINSLTFTVMVAGHSVTSTPGFDFHEIKHNIENNAGNPTITNNTFSDDQANNEQFMHNAQAQINSSHPLHDHLDVFNHPVSMSVELLTFTPNYYLSSPIEQTKYVKLGQSSAYEYSLIKGQNKFKSIHNENIVQSTSYPIIYGRNTIYPGYLPRASNIDIVIEELPSVNQYQHNSRSVFERKSYKYHENGSYKDNVSVIVNSTNLHEISLNRLTFKFYLSGSNKIYNQTTPTPTPPTYDELIPSSTDLSTVVEFRDAFPMLPSGDIFAVFHNDTVEYKQISMTITVKVKEN